MNNKNKIAKLKFYFLILLIIISLIISVYLKIKGFSVHDIKFLLNSSYAPFYFIFFYATISFLPIPFAPTMFLGALIFPYFQAIIYTTIGNIIFSTLAFYIARFLGKDYIDYVKEKNPKFKKFNLKIRKSEFQSILFLRFFFIIPGEIINVYAGITKMHYKKFILASTIGNLPVIMCTAGLIRGQIRNDPISITLSLIGLTTILIIPIIYSNVLKKRFRWIQKK